MIRVRNLTKKFKKLKAVDQLSFDIEEGESVALWGENGAGKTTAIRCLLGVIPFEGEVSLGGFDTLKEGKHARRLLGFVPQEISFHDDLTVYETIQFYIRLKRLDEETGYIVNLMERLGLVAYIDKKVRDLSGGMKQRLALVIALLADPPVIILDEPTANLDIVAREEFLGLLGELKESGKTLIFSSHRLDEVSALAERVLIIEAGKLAGDCPPKELGSRLAGKSMLKLHFADETWIRPAVETLIGNGFTAERNGTGVWVQVVPMEKAKPISLLAEKGIPVSDFQID